MAMYGNNYDSFKQFKSQMDRSRLCSILIILYAVLQISPCVCLGLNKVNFAAFSQIHQEQYDLIQAGVLQMRYKKYEFIPEQLLHEELDRARTAMAQTKARFHEDPNLSDYQKGDLSAQAEEAFQHQSKRLSVPERKMDLYRTFTFDLSAEKCRLEEEPAEPNVSEPVFRDADLNKIVITSKDGTQLTYNKDWDAATFHKISIPAARLPVYFGGYLGIVTPRQLKGLPEHVNVTVSEESLAGHDVVVYKLTESGQDRELRIYADPLIGYRYRQVESAYEGKLVRKIIAKDYQSFDGIAFPTFYEETTYTGDPNNPIRKRETIQVQNAQFNRDIDPNVFKIQFTTDTIITGPMLGLRFKPCPDKSAKLGVEDILERLRAPGRK